MILSGFFEAFIITIVISIDSFVATFAYGSNRTKIPFLSLNIINIICCVVLAGALLSGSFISQHVPEELTILISSLILFILGLFRIIDSLGTMLEDNRTKNKPGRKKKRRTISLIEAVSLGIALSLDAIVIGFGIALIDINIVTIIFTALIVGFIAKVSGYYIGEKIASRINMNISWLGGIILIFLAFLNFV